MIVAGDDGDSLPGLKTVVRRKGKAELEKVQEQSVPEVKEVVERGATRIAGRKRAATGGLSKEEVPDPVIPWQPGKIRKPCSVGDDGSEEGGDVSEDSPPGSGCMSITLM